MMYENFLATVNVNVHEAFGVMKSNLFPYKTRRGPPPKKKNSSDIAQVITINEVLMRVSFIL